MKKYTEEQMREAAKWFDLESIVNQQEGGPLSTASRMILQLLEEVTELRTKTND